MQKQCNLYNIEPDFKSYLETNHYSRTSINNYVADLRTFLSWIVMKLRSQQLDFDIKYVNQSTINSYKAFLMKKNVPVKTINRHLSSLRTFIRFCIHENWIQDNPINDINNINMSLFSSLFYNWRRLTKTVGIFSLGFMAIIVLFAAPAIILSKRGQNSTQNSLLLTTENPTNTSNRIASTSADLLTIPIIDQKGNLNLTAPYPKIIGLNGTLTVIAPQLVLESQEKGNISMMTNEGSIQFLFEGTIPPLPYESAFYFSSNGISQGSLILGQTVNTGSSINLLELSSGMPAESKFKVDADGNVYIKGNIILEGNLIVNPRSNIFGSLATETATSSFSPQP